MRNRNIRSIPACIRHWRVGWTNKQASCHRYNVFYSTGVGFQPAPPPPATIIEVTLIGHFCNMCQGFCNDEVFPHDVDHGRNMMCSWVWLAYSALPAMHGTSALGLWTLPAGLAIDVQLHDLMATELSADAGEDNLRQVNALLQIYLSAKEAPWMKKYLTRHQFFITLRPYLGSHHTIHHGGSRRFQQSFLDT